jgi:hypothetical protein
LTEAVTQTLFEGYLQYEDYLQAEAAEEGE